MFLAHITGNEHNLLVGLLTIGILVGMVTTVAMVQSYMEKRKGAK